MAMVVVMIMMMGIGMQAVPISCPVTTVIPIKALGAVTVSHPFPTDVMRRHAADGRRHPSVGRKYTRSARRKKDDDKHSNQFFHDSCLLGHKLENQGLSPSFDNRP